MIDPCCRLCSSTHSLSDTKTKIGTILGRVTHHVTNIKLSDDSSLKYMCLDCIIQVYNCCQFVIKSRDNEEKLMESIRSYGEHHSNTLTETSREYGLKDDLGILSKWIDDQIDYIREWDKSLELERSSEKACQTDTLDLVDKNVQCKCEGYLKDASVQTNEIRLKSGERRDSVSKTLLVGKVRDHQKKHKSDRKQENNNCHKRKYGDLDHELDKITASKKSKKHVILENIPSKVDEKSSSRKHQKSSNSTSKGENNTKSNNVRESDPIIEKRKGNDRPRSSEEKNRIFEEKSSSDTLKKKSLELIRVYSASKTKKHEKNLTLSKEDERQLEVLTPNEKEVNIQQKTDELSSPNKNNKYETSDRSEMSAANDENHEEVPRNMTDVPPSLMKVSEAPDKPKDKMPTTEAEMNSASETSKAILEEASNILNSIEVDKTAKSQGNITISKKRKSSTLYKTVGRSRPSKRQGTAKRICKRRSITKSDTKTNTHILIQNEPQHTLSLTIDEEKLTSAPPSLGNNLLQTVHAVAEKNAATSLNLDHESSSLATNCVDVKDESLLLVAGIDATIPQETKSSIISSPKYEEATTRIKYLSPSSCGLLSLRKTVEVMKICSLCEQTIYTKSEIRRHRKTHMQCKHCKRKFRSLRKTYIHSNYECTENPMLSYVSVVRVEECANFASEHPLAYEQLQNLLLTYRTKCEKRKSNTCDMVKPSV